jgi:RNA polymerase subunit RPABC4/transcription elongation factor Spt4
MNEALKTLLNDEIRICELCGSNEWRILHAGDESNCECEGECLRVCDSTLLSDDGCDGVAILINKEREELSK